MATLRIKQVRSTISSSATQKRTMKALGLGKINRVVEFEDNAVTKGQIVKVQHLIEVTEA